MNEGRRLVGWVGRDGMRGREAVENQQAGFIKSACACGVVKGGGK